ncbi:hypothetical protein KJF94_14720 [Pseudomonas hormoni]|uniref:Uncharacterized protein n=1 Tax=Pseudomonas hormoni TaxID=3093767 RepID=A0ABX8F824_9PSED|nr:hypothetical protein [Pseudomonas hormoni]QVW26708.1 hypothetical protein KJF94_14720 [Pseudomonas hormoni]
MPSCKRLRSVCHSLAHHAASSLSYVHPHLSEALRTLNTSFAAFDLMERDVCPPALESHPYLSNGLKSVQARFVEILEREGFTLSALQGATVLFKFDQDRLDDFGCECHARLVTPNGREYVAAVNYLGKSIVPQFG